MGRERSLPDRVRDLTSASGSRGAYSVVLPLTHRAFVKADNDFAELAFGSPSRLMLARGPRAEIEPDPRVRPLTSPIADAHFLSPNRVELRYKFGKASMQRFTQAYARHRVVDGERLALWQVYVAAAAQRFMGEWGLAPALEVHMRTEALASIREAGAALMGQTAW